MADNVDLASDYSDNIVAAGLSALRKQPTQKRGVCLYCGEPVQGVFCPPDESDCRDSWEKEQELLKLNGKN